MLFRCCMFLHGLNEGLDSTVRPLHSSHIIFYLITLKSISDYVYQFLLDQL